jgi:hypothetical protein
MSFHVWTEIVCLNCANTVAGNFTMGTIRRRAMRREAEAAGWIRSPELDDWVCCKSCLDEALAEKKARA